MTTQSPYRWVILASGVTAQAVAAAALLGLPAITPILRTQLRLDMFGIGAVLGSVSLGMFLTLLAWGTLADRIGERQVIIRGMASATALFMFLSVTRTATTVILLLILTGACLASANAASGRAVMHWFGPDERGLALGIRQTAMPIGAAVAAVSLPLIAGRDGLQGAFLALGAASLVGSVSALALRDGNAPKPRGPHINVLTNQRIWLIAAGAGILVLVQFSLLAFLVIFFHERVGFSLGAAAGLLAVAQAISAAGRILIGYFSDRLGSRLGFLIVICAVLALVLVLAAVLPASLAAGALLIAAVLAFSWNSLAFTATAEIAGPHRSGTALGLQNTVQALAGSLAPPAFGYLLTVTSWPLGFVALAGCTIMSALVLAFACGSRGRAS